MEVNIKHLKHPLRAAIASLMLEEADEVVLKSTQKLKKTQAKSKSDGKEAKAKDDDKEEEKGQESEEVQAKSLTEVKVGVKRTSRVSYKDDVLQERLSRLSKKHGCQYDEKDSILSK